MRRLLLRLPVRQSARIRRRHPRGSSARRARNPTPAYAWPRALGTPVRAQRACCRSRLRSFGLRLYRGIRGVRRSGGAVCGRCGAGRLLSRDAAQRDGSAVRRRVRLCAARTRHGRARLPCGDRAGRCAAGRARFSDAALSRRRRTGLSQRWRTARRQSSALPPFHLVRLPALPSPRRRWRRSITTCWGGRHPMRGTTCRSCSARSAGSGWSSGRGACCARSCGAMQGSAIPIAHRHGHGISRDAAGDKRFGANAADPARHGRDGAAAGAASRHRARPFPDVAVRQVRARHLPFCRPCTIRAREASSTVSVRSSGRSPSAPRHRRRPPC